MLFCIPGVNAFYTHRATSNQPVQPSQPPRAPTNPTSSPPCPPTQPSSFPIGPSVHLESPASASGEAHGARDLSGGGPSLLGGLD